MTTLEEYLDLVPAEHRNKPKFVAMLTALLTPFVETQELLAHLSLDFDVDTAVGSQLDVVGMWVGVSRVISTPLTGVYFSFDTAGVGLDQGTWFNEFDPVDGLTVLPDDAYRTLLRARIANNQWDGTIPGAYEVWDSAFSGTGVGILIQDYGNMHMLFALTGPVPDALTLSLFTGGYLNVKPAGVQIDDYATPSVPDVPYFGFDVENDAIAGFDVGAWAVLTPGV